MHCTACSAGTELFLSGLCSGKGYLEESTWEGKELWYGKTSDLDELAKARAEKINATYWSSPGMQ